MNNKSANNLFIIVVNLILLFNSNAACAAFDTGEPLILQNIDSSVLGEWDAIEADFEFFRYGDDGATTTYSFKTVVTQIGSYGTSYVDGVLYSYFDPIGAVTVTDALPEGGLALCQGIPSFLFKPLPKDESGISMDIRFGSRDRVDGRVAFLLKDMIQEMALDEKQSDLEKRVYTNGQTVYVCDLKRGTFRAFQNEKLQFSVSKLNYVIEPAILKPGSIMQAVQLLDIPVSTRRHAKSPGNILLPINTDFEIDQDQRAVQLLSNLYKRLDQTKMMARGSVPEILESMPHLKDRQYLFDRRNGEGVDEQELSRLLTHNDESTRILAYSCLRLVILKGEEDWAVPTAIKFVQAGLLDGSAAVRLNSMGIMLHLQAKEEIDSDQALAIYAKGFKQAQYARELAILTACIQKILGFNLPKSDYPKDERGFPSRGTASNAWWALNYNEMHRAVESALDKADLHE